MGMRKSTFGQVAAVLVALFVPSTCNLSKGSGGGNGGTPSDGISGLVKTPSGTGIADVSVSTGSRSTLTDSNGNYTISGLANGTYTVSVSYPNYTFTPSSSSETVNNASVSGVAFTAATISGLPAPPALPTISSYTASVPSTSTLVLVETPAPTLGEDFEPTLTAVTPTSTGTLSPLPDGPYAEQRIQLMNTSGAIVTDPLEAPALPNFPYVTIRALSAKPVLELIEYRQLLGNVHRYAAGTDTSVTTTYTYGVSSTQSSSFTSTVGASATASVGFGPAKVSATVSTQFSSTTSSSKDIQSSQSTSTTFTVQVPSTENVVYAEWQLVYELRLALYDPSSPSADEFGYVPYTDPNFAFLASDMAPVYIYEQNQIVPETAFFAN